jgi:hypothetical protein
MPGQRGCFYGPELADGGGQGSDQGGAAETIGNQESLEQAGTCWGPAVEENLHEALSSFREEVG